MQDEVKLVACPIEFNDLDFKVFEVRLQMIILQILSKDRSSRFIFISFKLCLKEKLNFSM